MQHNHLQLTATLAARSATRYTPAGVPAVDAELAHSSRQREAGVECTVQASLKAIAFGALAEQLQRCEMGQTLAVQGFVAAARNGKGLRLHIQALQIVAPPELT